MLTTIQPLTNAADLEAKHQRLRADPARVGRGAGRL